MCVCLFPPLHRLQRQNLGHQACAASTFACWAILLAPEFFFILIVWLTICYCRSTERFNNTQCHQARRMRWVVSKVTASQHIFSRYLSALFTQGMAPVSIANSLPLSKYINDMVLFISTWRIHKYQAVYDVQEQSPGFCEGHWVLCAHACICVHVHLYSGPLVCITVRVCVCKQLGVKEKPQVSVHRCPLLFMAGLLESHICWGG